MSGRPIKMNELVTVHFTLLDSSLDRVALLTRQVSSCQPQMCILMQTSLTFSQLTHFLFYGCKIHSQNTLGDKNEITCLCSALFLLLFSECCGFIFVIKCSSAEDSLT